MVSQRKKKTDDDKMEILKNLNSQLVLGKAIATLYDDSVITKREREALFTEHPTQESNFDADIVKLSSFGSEEPTFKEYESIVKD